MGALVWIMPGIVVPWPVTWLGGSGIVRSSALTMPDVTVRVNPIGFPIASTVWPTFSLDESPRAITGRSGALIWMTARSSNGSWPTSLPWTC